MSISRFPLVAAHRGYSALYPENTLSSFRAAAALGVDFIECDLRLTGDEVPMVIHDASLDRTTTGTGAVSAHTAVEVMALDAGSWKGSEFSGEPVPTLAEVLTLSLDPRLIVEIKDRHMAAQVVDVMRQAACVPSSVTVFSFAPDALVDLRALEPGINTVWLIDDVPHEEHARTRYLSYALSHGVQGIGLDHRQLDADLVRLARLHCLSVFCWTVNELDDMIRLIHLGVDAIISDYPDRLLALKARYGS